MLTSRFHHCEDDAIHKQSMHSRATLCDGRLLCRRLSLSQGPRSSLQQHAAKCTPRAARMNGGTVRSVRRHVPTGLREINHRLGSSLHANTQLRALSSSAVCGPKSELEELRDLVERLSSTNSIIDKKAMLQRASPDTRELIRYIYRPSTRLHVTSKSLLKYLSAKGANDIGAVISSAQQEFRQTSLLNVFKELEGLNSAGHEALERLLAYARHAGVFAEGETSSHPVSLLDIYLRCIDRNLRAGISSATIESTFAGVFHESVASTSSFSTSLGFSIKPEELPTLFSRREDTPWFVSRKLDGVRCILKIEAWRGVEDSSFKIHSVTPLSRNGKEFKTLAILVDEATEFMAASPTFRNVFTQSLSESKGASDEGQIFIDGEVCILEQVYNEQNAEDFIESFRGVAGQMQRKSHTIPSPAFFPFDVLTSQEFLHWNSIDAGAAQAPFAERIERVRGIVDECIRKGSRCIRHLEQVPVRSADEVRRWADVAATKNWEGLILRDGTSRFEGKRTKTIRKVKEMCEDEYTVEDVEVGNMRLAIDQKFAQRRALASIVIRHKGTRVNVGSGFTAEQRIRYAAQPHLIIGAQVTVAYFEESHADTRPGNEQPSLRFPVIKAVWEQGQREI